MPKEGKGFKLIIISKQKQLNTYESLQLMNGLEAKAKRFNTILLMKILCVSIRIAAIWNGQTLFCGEKQASAIVFVQS